MNNHSLMKIFHICIDKEGAKIQASTLYRRGIVLVDEIGSPVNEISKAVGEMLKNQFGLSNALWSNTFHKSLEKVATAPIEQLITEQLIHYCSTYGMEALGYKAIPVIPFEQLNLNFDEQPNVHAFTVIRVVSETTAEAYIKEYLRITLAPNKALITDIIDLMGSIKITPDEVASFELKCHLYNKLNIVPENGADFLRFLFYHYTDSTLLVKNQKTINELKNAIMYDYDKKIVNAFKNANLEKLAESFYRFKPLFLALKSPETAPYINRIRRLAKTNHKPLSDINVQNYSKLHAEGRITEALDVVAKASLRQLIKLNNYMTDLCKRQTDDVAVYNIRSGSIFVDEKSHANTDYAHTGWFMVFNELKRRLAGKLAGKTYFIPHYINYAMPVSEKQFVGSMPYGTLIHCPAKKAFTAAIAWENYKNERTDLDLHLTGEQSYGWNSGYRANDSAILYSGDMTDATNGAAEAFYFKPQSDDTYVLSANNFTGHDGVPFKFFLTEKKFKACANSSTAPVDVKDALFAPIELTFKDSENMMLGVFADGDFLFYSGTTSGRIPNAYMKSGRKAMYNKTRNVLSVRQFLELAGAKVVDETEVSEDCPAISLAPACLTPQTFFEILEETT